MTRKGRTDRPGQGPQELPLRGLLEALPVGAFACDATGLITWCNQRAAAIWGREPKLDDPEDRFMGSAQLFAPDGSPVLPSQSWLAMALMLDRGFDGKEMIIERPGGDRVNVLVHVQPLHGEDGTLAGAIAVLVDVTERHGREESSRMSDAPPRQAASGGSLGMLAGGIAHDINNLLTAVLGNASLAMLSLPADSPARSMLGDIEKAAREAAGLAGRMLAHAHGGPADAPHPVTPGTEPPAPVEGSRRASTRTSRTAGLVLVVDDSETVRAVTQRALETAGFEVLVASDGIEAIEIFQAHGEEIAAILLDLTMPRMHGLEAFKRLRAIEPVVPILVMSGYAEAEVAGRFAGMNATGFIQKPFRAQEVISRLTQIIPLLPRE